ncbi:MAG: hypothetical protein R2824_14155 [Saprospiraceae bacterium]|nr:hypothetical protein [Lewinella sp.]
MSHSFFDFDLFAAPEPGHFLKDLKGRGRAGILVIFEFDEDATPDQEYLEAILRPLKLDLQNDAFFLALQKKEAISVASVLQQYESKYILIFGGELNRFGIRLRLPDYQPVKFQGKYFLKADSLQQIRTDRENKDNRRAGALWNALKEIFTERLQ